MKLGLLTRKERWALTLRGKLLALGIIAAVTLVVRWEAHPFLAVNSPIDGELLIVEGWIPLHIMDQAAAEFYRGHYHKLFLMRTRLDEKHLCSVMDNETDYMAHTLIKLGVPNDKLYTLSCYVGEKDRTYQAALGLREWFGRNEMSVRSFNVATAGPHARRSWLTYQRAFASTSEVGIVALKDTSYDSQRWWRTTKGVRETLWESIAYVYARFFFVWR